MSALIPRTQLVCWFVSRCYNASIRRGRFGRKPKGAYLASTRHPAGPRKQHGLAVLLRRVQLIAHGRINPALDHLGDVLNVALRVVDTGHIAVIVYAEINGTALGVGEGAHALEPVLRPAPPDLHPVVAAGCLAIQIQRHVPILLPWCRAFLPLHQQAACLRDSNPIPLRQG